jgi:hypothetical protein
VFASIVNFSRIGTQGFLRVGRYLIPVDRIREFDFSPPEYSGCDVIIFTDEKQSYGFSGELARQLEEFLDASAEAH